MGMELLSFGSGGTKKKERDRSRTLFVLVVLLRIQVALQEFAPKFIGLFELLCG